jgi:GPH family glycoside/pentoside/hexuronide:cation symporter
MSRAGPAPAPVAADSFSQAVPVRIAAAWGVGSFATTTMLNGVSLVLLYFLVRFVDMEPVVAGALLFGSKLVDAVTDPPLGLVSDRTRSRWGRRRPFLLGSAVFCGFSFALLFNVPMSLSGLQVHLFIAFGLLLYTLSYTAFQVPYMAMPAEMTDSWHERTRIMQWRVVFMTAGNMMGSSGAPLLVAMLGGERAAYGQMGVILGLVIAAAMLLTFLGTAGARQTPRPAVPSPLGLQLRWTLQNRPLLVLMTSKIVVYSGISAFTAVMLFFFASVLKKGPAELGLFALVMAVSTILFTPLHHLGSRWIRKKTAYLWCFAGYALGLLSWLAATPDESLLLFVLRGAWLGFFNAGLFLYGNSMLIDTFAWDYQRTGVRREGFLSAAFSFVEKTALALGPLVIGTLLSAMGFDRSLPAGADQSPEAVRAMYLGFVWIPVAAQLSALVLLLAYRLEEEDLRDS